MNYGYYRNTNQFFFGTNNIDGGQDHICHMQQLREDEPRDLTLKILNDR